MELTQALTGRRSIRAFKPDPVPDEAIARIVEAGLWAPSGMNRQSSIVIAVTEPKVRERLRAENARIGGWEEGFDPFYGAPVVLVVLARADVPTHVYDGSLTMGNMLMAAHEEGLGACWIHRAKEEFEQPAWQEWLHGLGVEGDYEGVGHVALGYADGDHPAPKPVRDGRVFWVK